jgi:hypothetical protein
MSIWICLLATGSLAEKDLGLLLEWAGRQRKQFILDCFGSSLESYQEVDVLIDEL